MQPQGSASYRAAATAVLVIWTLWPATAAAQTARQWAQARGWMVESDVATAGVKNPAVLAAMRTVPRHEFVPADLRAYAYVDTSLPIGHRQTISPPFIVAWMTEQLDPQPADRVLEIGTGSGYQAAVLSQLVREVYTIEINEPLGKQARRTFERLGYKNVQARIGDGFLGWPEAAPFDKIMVTCSPEKVPAPLVEQLREGGRMLIPVGQRFQQDLCVLSKQNGSLVVERREPTYFVPMTGTAESLRSAAAEGPLTPLVNGDFEQLLEDRRPTGWYYVRQADVEQGGPNETAGHYLSFTNRVPGMRSQALQTIGVDGRKIGQLSVAVRVKAVGVQPADQKDPQDGAGLVVSFFDDLRQPIGEQVVGPWRGSFDWRQESVQIEVPPEARGAAVLVGLLGSTGRLDCDDIEVRASQPRTAKSGFPATGDRPRASGTKR